MIKKAALFLAVLLVGCQSINAQGANPPGTIVAVMNTVAPTHTPAAVDPIPASTPTPALTPTPAPPPMIRDIGVAYDGARGEVLLFGGALDGCDPCGETWVWNGGWARRSPQDAPSPRRQPALAYDPIRKTVVLFGGWDGQSTLNDTWLWDGKNWTEQHPAVFPVARYNAMMIYDESLQQVVLFGGERLVGRDTVFQKDTWAWDGAVWRKQAAALPASGSPRPSLAYDAQRQQGVLWQYGKGTWTWNGRAWAHPQVTNGPAEPYYIEAKLGYDGANQKVILFGINPRMEMWVPETWVWNDPAWVRVDTGNGIQAGPKSPAYWPVYDEQRHQLLLIAAVGNKLKGYSLSVWGFTGKGWELLDGTL